MDVLSLKPSHKAVTAYYQELEAYARLGVTHEMAVRDAFQALLKVCCAQAGLTFVGEWKLKRKGRAPLSVDGAMVGFDELARGYWEAKDAQDDLVKEVKRKFAAGYPKDNIIFQSPLRAILYQNGRQVLDEDITRPEALVSALKQFFEYRAPQIEKWEDAAEKFQERVPELAESVIKLIERERKTNKRFIAAFAEFTELCSASINPNISDKAVEEMLIQHLLTERIFRNVFNNPDFTSNNIIAVEIEKVIRALTSQTFNRAEFLKSNDYFYRALEETAATIDDFSQKQSFLNSVYERFFQGFSVKVADTHGIVYTPQPIVNFMVKSVEDILQKEFGKSFSDAGVHILDPFVGTGNFMLRVMQEIKRTRLQEKYASELHCNEVMLLPYYIASMNIEHTFYDLTNNYQPFEGICLVDTFDITGEGAASGTQMPLVERFNAENTKRVEKQKKTHIFVVIGNPPYNVGQVNENDNNKNRKYKIIDQRVSDTYARDSKASSVSKLNNPYIKAIRWASDRLTGDGIVAFITMNGFIDKRIFDGVRKHLENDFDKLYILDLGGDTKSNPKLSGTVHNVFGIPDGVSINFFVRCGSSEFRKAQIHYAYVDEFWRREKKLTYLEETNSYKQIEWRLIQPDENYTWLTEGLRNDFDGFISLGSRTAKESKRENVECIFKTFSNGNDSGRDDWVYNFNRDELLRNVRVFADTYNSEIDRWIRSDRPTDIDSFVIYDDRRIKWTRNAKRDLKRERYAEFSPDNVRVALYRPFVRQYLYSGRIFNKEVALLPIIFPSPRAEEENRIICVCGYGRKAFSLLMGKSITDLNLYADPAQCFPLYTYNEDGTIRRENITDWALSHFRAQYTDKSISKPNIFHYVYALLHHPAYRETYTANLKRELPRIPFVKSRGDFRAFVLAGERLADLHVNYEAQPEYKLERVENEDAALDWRVERMKLSKDKTSIVYNDFLSLEGIPLEAFDYRLGNRSALEWIVDQYQVSTDKRSGITNDPNREDEPDYIVKLIGKVTTVSIETVNIVRGLPALQLSE